MALGDDTEASDHFIRGDKTPFFSTNGRMDNVQNTQPQCIAPPSQQNPVFVQNVNVTSTSKNRMKVSTYSTGFFGTFQHNKSDDIWDESTVTGATVVWDPNWCAIKCQVTSTVGSKVIRQTRNVMRYVPGRPAEFSNAYFWGTPVLGVRKRIGQFDERNGFFLEQDVTIAMLAHLATYKGIWGPHLIVVPTSCIVNWEAEFKRWCPTFKILTYYGSANARKNLRNGWMKLNSFHVCITSYQLVVQDSNSFKRKRWYYMILDEAHNIKNFKSQRWQTLLNFNTQRRLLLTGTPLQNNLMELWSLLHFLMPHVFRSRKEFSYWFSSPLSSMVEGNRGVNNDLIGRFHGIMRPFLLRRLKKDVAKQLPGKYEHIVLCKLSKRQLHLYEEFMSRSATRALLSGGNFMGMMNVLMQLRKVCNHPDLFEPRAILSPFISENIIYSPGNLPTRAQFTHPLHTLSRGLTDFWAIDEDDFISAGN